MADEDFVPDDGDEGALDAPVTDEPTQPEPQPSIDEIAADMGWKPQDQWRGDPDKWRPAADYVRTTAKVNRNLNDKVRGFEDQLTRMARVQELALETVRKQEREKLQAERDAAWDIGDKTRYEHVDTELKKLDESPLPPVPTVTPELETFKQRNPWLGADDEATRWAAMRGDELAKQGIGAKRQFDIVEREAKTLFPDLYPTAPEPARGAPLNRPGARGGRVQAKGFSSLPAEAQQAADYYVRKGVFANRDEYAAAFYSEQEA